MKPFKCNPQIQHYPGCCWQPIDQNFYTSVGNYRIWPAYSIHKLLQSSTKARVSLFKKKNNRLKPFKDCFSDSVNTDVQGLWVFIKQHLVPATQLTVMLCSSLALIPVQKTMHHFLVQVVKGPLHLDVFRKVWKYRYLHLKSQDLLRCSSNLTSLGSLVFLLSFHIFPSAFEMLGDMI